MLYLIVKLTATLVATPSLDDFRYKEYNLYVQQRVRNLASIPCRWKQAALYKRQYKQGVNMITQEELQQLLHYDPDTGLFTWKCKKSNSVRANRIAGTINDNGYVIIQINGKLHKAHRLAWLYVHGKFPSDQIDHINQIRYDNRISNLRCVSNQKNHFNRKKQVNNTSGYTGVHWCNKDKIFISRIKISGKRIILGRFNCKQEAHQAYLKAKAELHII